jgi:broad specificity phosphatase PhoE
MAISIVFETHSISEDNERGVATGWLPGRLSPEGRRLAQELGQRRRGDGLDAVFTSDLMRAVETARIAFAGSAIPVVQDRRLREISYGTLNGTPAPRIHSMRREHVDTPFPGGQSYREVVHQMQAFLNDIAAGRDRQRLLLIGHSATKFALDCLLAGRPLEDAVTSPFDWQPGWEYRLEV